MSVWEDSEWVEKVASAEPEAKPRLRDYRSIVHVQPMTGPIEGVDFYRPRYANHPTKQFDRDGKEPR